MKEGIPKVESKKELKLRELNALVDVLGSPKYQSMFTDTDIDELLAANRAIV